MHSRRKKRVALVLGLFIILLLAWVSVQPSLIRDWSPDQAVLPFAEIDQNRIRIHNIRNFSYRSTDDFDVAYYDKTFDLNQLQSVWYVVEPFSNVKGLAHTFLSFGFAGSEYVAISIEIRKERGEKFSPVKGLLKRFEIMYVIGDERDLLQLRTNFRKNDVYLYPVKTSQAAMQELFLSMIQRTNELSQKPEFYHSLLNSCTTNIVRHINEIVPGRIPLSFKILLPEFSDELGYELGLIDTELSLNDARVRFHTNERAALCAQRADFSRCIREEIIGQ